MVNRRINGLLFNIIQVNGHGYHLHCMAIEEDGPTYAHKAVLQLLSMSPPRTSRSDKLHMNASSIAHSLGYQDTAYIWEVCDEMADLGLLDRKEKPYFSITYEGRAYLEGDLDASGLESKD